MAELHAELPGLFALGKAVLNRSVAACLTQGGAADKKSVTMTIEEAAGASEALLLTCRRSSCYVQPLPGCHLSEITFTACSC